MDILNFTCTYTTKFILPLLFEHISYNRLFNESFINAYIADMDSAEYNDKIHLYFSDYPSLSIQKYLPETIAELKIDDGYVLIYDIPKEFADDYIKFLTGDYSKFSNTAKVRIISFWGVDNNTLLWGVLYKEGDKIKNFYKKELDRNLDELSPSAEWWLPPRIESEIFTGRLQ
jgi:hypothetical protein